jgi:hypothetical protein
MFGSCEEISTSGCPDRHPWFQRIWSLQSGRIFALIPGRQELRFSCGAFRPLRNAKVEGSFLFRSTIPESRREIDPRVDQLC